MTEPLQNTLDTKLKNTFFSRFTPTNQSILPSKSMSTLSQRKKYEAILGVKAEDIFPKDTKKSHKLGTLFRKKRSKSITELCIEEEDESKLSKRLSGGHYGSAGGLLLSIREHAPPDDIAMIDWKRRSDQLLELQNVPKPQANMTVEKPKRPTRALPPQPFMEDAKECALRLWHEDELFVPREQIAEWLGQSKSLHIETLREYMTFFDFSRMRLDSAFRKMCSKLYFRAEAQQIDRILEAFAKQYWQCNPKSILGSADIVYAVVYSLLLLNTDLHVAQGNHTRMSRQEFVRNTMSTVLDQTVHKRDMAWETHIEAYLKDMYVSVKNHQILQPMSREEEELSSKRMSVMMTGKRMTDMKRSLNTMMHKSPTRESMLFLEESTLSRKSTSSSSHWPPTPRESFTTKSMYSAWKEGIVMRKHLLESKHQKARHREWRECLLVVGQGEFKLYDGELQKLKSSSTDNNSILSNEDGHRKWGVKVYSQLMCTVDLSHTLSNALPPPGYNRSRPYVFALQESNGGVYLVQCDSPEQVNDWVETCNYWAARQSKEPLQGGVGNIEYGWGDCLNDVILDSVENGNKITGHYIRSPDTVHLSIWTPPTPSMVPSILDERSQLDSIQRYVDQLNEEINEHREIKNKILVKFQYKSPNQSRALLNWEAKSTYMLHEIIKYQNYCNVLEKRIKDNKEHE